MFGSIFESLYNKVFVNIVVDGAKSRAYIEMSSAKAPFEKIKSSTNIFETATLTPKLLDFIESYTKETPYFYISFLDNSLSQGALPACKKEDLSKYADLTLSKHRCVDEQWSCYTLAADFDAMRRRYEAMGVDFVFSPFALLSDFFKDKIKSNFAMYVLVQTSSLSLAVFENGKLLFAEHLDMHHMIEEDRLSGDDLDESFDLDDEIDLEGVNVDEDDLSIIDDFSDIEDLDSIEDIDEFAQHRDVEEELLNAIEEQDDEEEEVGFNEDYQRFTLIQSSIATYYKDARFESNFIENLYVADSVGVSSELKKYLEEEMFLSVYVRKIDLAMELCDMAKMELKA